MPPLHTIVGVSKDAIWFPVNLDDHAQVCFPAVMRSGKRKIPLNNPMLNPSLCAEWVSDLAREAGATYTYGGYMENRAHLWRGSYLRPSASVHLGVDINVPAGTDVYCPVPFKVIELFADEDQNGGWGGRAIVKVAGGYVVFAHILHATHLNAGQEYRANVSIGVVQSSDRNGGWYPHLHLQGLRDISLLNGLDGYGRGGPSDRRSFPNPLALLS